MNGIAIAAAGALLLACSTAGLAANHGELRPAANQVRVVLDATFDVEGRVAELRPHGEAEYPAAFWSGLQQRLTALKIPSPRDASGRLATLRTGLYVGLEVVQGGPSGQVRIVDLDVGPLVLKQAYAGYPTDIAQSAGWTGQVEAECMVGTDGRCGAVKVNALPGMPPSVLRWAAATLELWQFQPPQMNGVALAVPFRRSFSLATTDHAPVEFRYRGSGNAPFRW